MPPPDSNAPLAHRPLTAADLPVTNPLMGSALLPWDQAQATVVAPPNPAGAPPTLAGLLQALRRRWPWAVSLGLLAGLLGVVAVWLLMPPKYTATAILKLSSVRNPQMFGADADGIEFGVWKNSQPGILKSPLVIKDAFQEPGVRDVGLLRTKPDPVGWLSGALKTDFLLGPEVLRVTLSGDDAAETARVLNAVVAAYQTKLQTEERQKRKKTLDQLDDIYKKQEQELRESRSSLDNLKKDFKLEDEEIVNSRYRAAHEGLMQIEKDARELDFKAFKTKSEIDAMKREIENLAMRTIPDAAIDAYLKDDPAFGQFAKDMKSIDDLIHQTASTAREPRRTELLRGLQQLKGSALDAMDQYRKRQRPRVQEQIRGELVQKIEKMQSELGAVEQTQRDLKGVVARQQAEVQRLDPNNRKRAKQVGPVQDVLDKINQIAKFLEQVGLQKKNLESAPEPEPRVTPLAYAEPPAELDTSRQVKLGAAAGFGLFGLALFGVAFVEFRTRKIGSAQDVTQGTGMRVLGTLPALPARARKPLPGATGARAVYWQGILNESVDAIRTQLLHQARADGLSVVMVTSAVGGEGKTSLASHLAASLARAWKNTLLIDGDLRHPAAHKLFELPQEPGLSEVLRGEVDLADVVKPTAQSRLWLVSAGHWDSHAVQALAQDGVRSLFSELKKQFDFIIVDSSPVLPVADALALGQHVDAVIYTVLRDVSRGPAVLAAQQKLAALGVRSLGAVVIGAADNPHHASYQYTKGAR